MSDINERLNYRIWFAPFFCGPLNSYEHIVWAANYSQWSLDAWYTYAGVPFSVEERARRRRVRHINSNSSSRFETRVSNHSRDIRDPYVRDRIRREATLTGCHTAPWDRKHRAK